MGLTVTHAVPHKMINRRAETRSQVTTRDTFQIRAEKLIQGQGQAGTIQLSVSSPMFVGIIRSDEKTGTAPGVHYKIKKYNLLQSIPLIIHK